MKMIGRSVRSPAILCWRSRPLRSGSDTSSTRQPGASTRGRSRNSWAEAKASGRQPAQRISDSSDSRTDTSSSTMKTMGAAFDIAASVPSQRAGDGVQQRRLAEWLAKARHGPRFERAGTDGLVSVGGDEDNRDRLPAQRELPLEVEPRHAGHGDVEDQAAGLADNVRREEI